MTGARETPTDLFERARPRLWGLAYRMLGSAADADDAVQDTWLRWQGAAHDGIASPGAWLTAVCSRRCIDMLRAAHRARVDYVGPWLPEPLVGSTEDGGGSTAELAASLSTAFLLLLEQLTPAERAAYLLHDVFDYGYDEIGTILDKKQDACRQLVARARRHIAREKTRFTPEPGRQHNMLNAFMGAVRSGELGRLTALLAEDVQLWTDGGGKALAMPEIIHGAGEISGLLGMFWEKSWSGYDITETQVNGGTGLVMRDGGNTVAVLTLDLTPDGRIEGIYVVRNPDKLERVVA